MGTKNLDEDVKRLSTLDDDLRRSTYLFARRQLDGVNRVEAAKESGVSPKLAAFHLDKLADEGLLSFHYARPPRPHRPRRRATREDLQSIRG